MQPILKAFHDHMQAISIVSQLLVTLAVGIVPVYVYVYSRRKDKLEFFYNNWNKQQDVNIECLGNDELLRVVEELINGPQQTFNLNQARAFTFAFLHLNKIQNNFQAMRQGVLTKKEFLDMSVPSLRLFARNKEQIIYLVSQRGYDEAFRDTVIDCLASLSPYEIPPAPDPNQPAAASLSPPTIGPTSSQIAERPLANSWLNKYSEVLINWLHRQLERLLETKGFTYLSFSFILNPILLAIQLTRLVSSSSGDNGALSPVMFLGFAFLNVVTALVGIKIKSLAMFLSFSASFVLSALIVFFLLLSRLPALFQ